MKCEEMLEWNYDEKSAKIVNKPWGKEIWIKM